VNLIEKYFDMKDEDLKLLKEFFNEENKLSKIVSGVIGTDRVSYIISDLEVLRRIIEYDSYFLVSLNEDERNKNCSIRDYVSSIIKGVEDELNCNIIKRNPSRILDEREYFKDEKLKVEYFRESFKEILEHKIMFENTQLSLNGLFDGKFLVNENAFEIAKNFIKARMIMYDMLYGSPTSYTNTALFEAFTKKLIDLGFINTQLEFSD